MRKIHRQLANSIAGKKAVIWDFDGVLCFADWNFGEDVSIWWNKLWKLLEEYEPDIRNIFKQGLRYYYEHTDYVVSIHGQKALTRINDLYLQKELQILPASPINEKLVNLIENLDRNLEHYIWSNNQEAFIVNKLEKTGIFDKFRAVVSRDKVVLAKPNLEGFEIIQTLTDIPVKDFIFVGDSRNTDQVAAKRIGMDFFLYCR